MTELLLDVAAAIDCLSVELVGMPFDVDIDDGVGDPDRHVGSRTLRRYPENARLEDRLGADRRSQFGQDPEVDIIVHDVLVGSRHRDQVQALAGLLDKLLAGQDVGLGIQVVPGLVVVIGVQQVLRGRAALGDLNLGHGLVEGRRRGGRQETCQAGQEGKGEKNPLSPTNDTEVIPQVQLVLHDSSPPRRFPSRASSRKREPRSSCNLAGVDARHCHRAARGSL